MYTPTHLRKYSEQDPTEKGYYRELYVAAVSRRPTPVGERAQWVWKTLVDLAATMGGGYLLLSPADCSVTYLLIEPDNEQLLRAMDAVTQSLE